MKLRVDRYKSDKFGDTDSGIFNVIQFINETKFPLKVTCGTAGNNVREYKFTEAVQPRSHFDMESRGDFSVGGYVTIYLDGKLRSDGGYPDADVNRVFEFALSNPPLASSKVHIQETTGSEFTRGQDARDKMKDSESKIIYWLVNGKHHLASAELIANTWFALIKHWRFVFQDFDPVSGVFTSDKKS